MRLYHDPVSTDCRKVRVVAAELGMTLELVNVPRPTPASSLPPAAPGEPKGRVPALVDGDAVVSVPNAILQYMAERHPHVSLWPESSTLRAGIARWQLWEATDFGPAVRSLVEARLAPDKARGSEDDERRADMWFHCFAGVLDNHLQSRRYLVGEQPTLADFSVVAPLSLAEAAALPLERYVHIRMWRDRLEARPSMRSTPPCAPC